MKDLRSIAYKWGRFAASMDTPRRDPPFRQQGNLEAWRKGYDDFVAERNHFVELRRQLRRQERSK